MIMRGSKFYFRTSHDSAIKEYGLDNIKYYPNIPFHSRLWDEASYSIEVGNFLKNNVFETHSLLDRFSSKEMYILLPDDTQILEQRALEEFFFQAVKKLKKIIASFECHYMSPNHLNYISIAKTCRMFVITYIKDGYIKVQDFLDKKDYEFEELKNYIRDLHMDCRSGNLNIYLNGNDLEKYNSLGTMVSYQNLIDNFIHSPKIVDNPYLKI